MKATAVGRPAGRTVRPNGAVFYDGPSDIDSARIVGVITGLRSGSANAKTGAMLQTWILRADVGPLAAVATGDDVSICGDCKHRGDAARGVARTCYVNLGHAPRSVWAAYQRGIYGRVPDVVRAELGQTVRARAGSYGDPVAIPLGAWWELAGALQVNAWGQPRALRWTGYTHQWRKLPREYPRWLMASVDSLDEQREAEAAGWRTFRVIPAGAPLVQLPRIKLLPRVLGRGEIACPASAEAGKITTCERCLLCSGAGVGDRRANIVIQEH